MLDLLQRALFAAFVFGRRVLPPRPSLSDVSDQTLFGALCRQNIKEDYRRLVDEAVAFIENKSNRLRDEMTAKMEEASARQDFEAAMVYRDRIRALTSVQQGSNVNYAAVKSADFIAQYRANGRVCIQVFLSGRGQKCGNLPFFPQQAEEASEGRNYGTFLSGFYASHVPPTKL